MSNNTQTLLLNPDFFSFVSSNVSINIIYGYELIKKGKLLYQSIDGSQSLLVSVTNVSHKPVSEITEEELKTIGIKTLKDFIKLFKRYYKNINNDSEITIIKTKPIKNAK